MGNNAEIRKRIETYRLILLTIVWFIAIAGIISGIIMISYRTSDGWYSSNPLRTNGIALLISSIFGGVLGHFLVNVWLAIHFILLNNGDMLESLIKKSGSIFIDSIDPINVSPEEKVALTNIEGQFIFTESDIIRKGPGDHYLFVCRFKKDEIVERIKVDGEWSLIKKDNIEGWCLSSILKEK